MMEQVQYLEKEQLQQYEHNITDTTTGGTIRTGGTLILEEQRKTTEH